MKNTATIINELDLSFDEKRRKAQDLAVGKLTHSKYLIDYTFADGSILRQAGVKFSVIKFDFYELRMPIINF